MREQRDLRTVEVLLDHDPLTAAGVVECGGAVGGDHDPLAGREAVVLHDVRRAELVQRGRGLVGGDAHPGSRGGHTSRRHHLLGEGLGALQLGGRAGRAEAGDPPLRDGVGHPRDQRRLGPHHDQVHPERLGQVRDAGPDIGSTSCSVATAAMPGLPGAACTSATPGSSERARARACSRPPVPMTSVFRVVCCWGAVRSRAHRRHARPATRAAEMGAYTGVRPLAGAEDRVLGPARVPRPHLRAGLGYSSIPSTTLAPGPKTTRSPSASGWATVGTSSPRRCRR